VLFVVNIPKPVFIFKIYSLDFQIVLINIKNCHYSIVSVYKKLFALVVKTIVFTTKAKSFL
jgi:hypothetical protein